MLTLKQTTLKPLLESKDGIHLTAYLVNRGDLIDLKMQLRQVIDKSYEWLHPVMSKEECKKFLEPLDFLLNDARLFKQMKGNIGVFRNQNLFRVLNVPIDIEQSCQVATTFHVKPLLRWLQSDEEFLLLGIKNDSAFLYLGSKSTFKLLDSIEFPEFINVRGSFKGKDTIRKTYQYEIKQSESFIWLNDWILKMIKNSKLKLFLSGETSIVQAVRQGLRYKNIAKFPVSNFFNEDAAFELCRKIREIMKLESQKSIEKMLLEFKLAEEGNRAKKNIFQISKAVIQGKVKKLIVTDELSIFGKIDLKSGGLAIHPFDLDHEDDCILDDLAQIVLSQGGEVVVARRSEIPQGRPILAILEDDSDSIDKINLYRDGYFQEVLR